MLDVECSTERLISSSPQVVFVIGLAAERIVELAGISTGYRNSDDLSRDFIVMMLNLRITCHLGKYASNSNFLTEGPICRTNSTTHRQNVKHKSHGLDDVFEKKSTIFPSQANSSAEQQQV
jgi:hypothetical protein